MSIAEKLKENREKSGISQEDLAKKLSVPVAFITFLEDPQKGEEKMISFLASGLGITPKKFKGEAEKPREKVEKPQAKVEKPQEKKAKEEEKEPVIKPKFPHIRDFLLHPSHCQNPGKALKYFDNQEISLAERNLILYLSTTALYYFCDTNASNFAFENYLFKLHGPLVKKMEEDIKEEQLSAEEKEERLANARSNIFCCETIENIAIRIVSPFAQEMEKKLADEIYDFDDDLDLPFVWDIDQTLMKIEIMDSHGKIKDQIKLLDVKKRKKEEKMAGAEAK